METRVCSRCKIEKDVSNFSKDKRYRYKSWCKECSSIYWKEYYNTHKNSLKEYQKEYNKINKDKIKDRNQKYRRKYRQDNIEIMRKRDKEYYKKNKVTIIERQKKYYKKNKETITIKNKEYRALNKDRTNRNARNRYSNNEIVRFKSYIRNGIRLSFYNQKYVKGKYNFEEIIGIDIKTWLEYMNNSFIKRYGREIENKDKISIDHIIPLDIATTKIDVIKLSNYKNLQLLLLSDNCSKGKKIEREFRD